MMHDALGHSVVLDEIIELASEMSDELLELLTQLHFLFS